GRDDGPVSRVERAMERSSNGFYGAVAAQWTQYMAGWGGGGIDRDWRPARRAARTCGAEGRTICRDSVCRAACAVRAGQPGSHGCAGSGTDRGGIPSAWERARRHNSRRGEGGPGWAAGRRAIDYRQERNSMPKQSLILAVVWPAGLQAHQRGWVPAMPANPGPAPNPLDEQPGPVYGKPFPAT